MRPYQDVHHGAYYCGAVCAETSEHGANQTDAPEQRAWCLICRAEIPAAPDREGAGAAGVVLVSALHALDELRAQADRFHRWDEWPSWEEEANEREAQARLDALDDATRAVARAIAAEACSRTYPGELPATWHDTQAMALDAYEASGREVTEQTERGDLLEAAARWLLPMDATPTEEDAVRRYLAWTVDQ